MTVVRVMTRDDIDAVSAVRVRGWRTAYAGIVPQSYLDAMDAGADAERRKEWFDEGGDRVDNLVATDGGEVTGWAALGPYRGEPDGGEVGELYAIYVHPDRIGRGAGRALMDAVRARARERGFRSLRLWVLADNERALRFYDRCGFAPDGTDQIETYDGVPLKELRYVADPA
ncbi:MULTISPECIES: GNAT family N-acetyltransferase [unclassified Streptomyces]|uniref:GNAT family N-acetyltransferase n=1 Tax=unclassified Streptomyces TaxID=2593676 RepID=UPI0004783256|nr:MULTISPECIES: GNAT family N-acetyltransferase [unclassified Streptomyces]MYX35183.1 GNAT family N-acetyltransferase [Streptomyces sp. SID8377]